MYKSPGPKYKFFPKMMAVLAVISALILYLRREEYFGRPVMVDADTTAVDTLIVIPEVQEIKDVSFGLVAHYPFSGNAEDASRNENDGIVFNTELTGDRYGHPYSAVKFDGTGQYIEIPESPSIKSIKAAVTVTAWVYLTDYLAETGVVTHDFEWTLVLRLGHVAANVFNYPSGGGGVEGQIQIPLNSWHFIAMTYGAGLLRVYLNGRLEGEQRVHISQFGTASVRIYHTPAIGHGVGVYPKNFKGRIDDVYIYNRTLNGAEINMLYNRPRTIS